MSWMNSLGKYLTRPIIPFCFGLPLLIPASLLVAVGFLQDDIYLTIVVTGFVLLFVSVSSIIYGTVLGCREKILRLTLKKKLKRPPTQGFQRTILIDKEANTRVGVQTETDYKLKKKSSLMSLSGLSQASSSRSSSRRSSVRSKSPVSASALQSHFVFTNEMVRLVDGKPQVVKPVRGRRMYTRNGPGVAQRHSNGQRSPPPVTSQPMHGGVTRSTVGLNRSPTSLKPITSDTATVSNVSQKSPTELKPGVSTLPNGISSHVVPRPASRMAHRQNERTRVKTNFIKGPPARLMVPKTASRIASRALSPRMPSLQEEEQVGILDVREDLSSGATSEDERPNCAKSLDRPLIDFDTDPYCSPEYETSPSPVVMSVNVAEFSAHMNNSTLVTLNIPAESLQHVKNGRSATLNNSQAMDDKGSISMIMNVSRSTNPFL